MKRQPLISSYSKVFNFCFNLLDALSLVFKYFSPAEYSKLALIFCCCINVQLSLTWMDIIWKFFHRRKKSLKLIFHAALFEN